ALLLPGLPAGGRRARSGSPAPPPSASLRQAECSGIVRPPPLRQPQLCAGSRVGSAHRGDTIHPGRASLERTLERMAVRSAIRMSLVVRIRDPAGPAEA